MSKQDDRAEQESRIRYRELLENMSSGVAVYEAVDGGEDFIVREFNRAAERIDSIRREEVLGKRLTECFPGVKAFGLFDVIHQVWKTGIPEYHPANFYKDSRFEGWRENHVYRLPSGEVVCVYDDVTEQKETQDAHQQSQEDYRFLVENLNSILIRLDTEGRVTYVSPVVASHSSYLPKDIIGHPFSNFVHPDDAPELKKQLRFTLEGNPVIQLLGDTAAQTVVGQCNALYDMHFVHYLANCRTPPPLGTKARLKFRIMLYDEKESSVFVKDATLAPMSEEERFAKTFPRWEKNGTNSFEHSIALDRGDHSRSWRPFLDRFSDWDPGYPSIARCQRDDAACVWDDSVTRIGKRSLKAFRHTDGLAGWQLLCFERPDVQPGKQYRLSCYIKTKDAKGKGAYIGYLLAHEDPSGMSETPPHSTEPLTGNHDWTRVSIVTEPATFASRGSGQCKIRIILAMEGTGSAWFDDLVLEELKD